MNRQLLKDSFTFSFFIQITSIINFLFQLYLARNLSKFDYGLINSLLSIYVLIATPTLTLQNTLSRYTSELTLKNDFSSLYHLIHQSLRRIGYYGCIFLFLLLLFSKPLANFLHSPNLTYMVLLGFCVFLSFLIPILVGTLLGMQKFTPVGILAVGSTLIKLIITLFVIYLGFTVGGVLTAFLMSLLLMLILTYLFTKSLLLKKPLTTSNISLVKKEIKRYALKSCGVLFCLSFLTFFDVIVVQHFFGHQNSNISGVFAIASVMAKMILYTTQPFIFVMIPKVTELYHQRKKTLPLLLWYLFLTFLGGSVLSMLFLSFPNFFIHFFTKTDTQQVLSLLPLYMAALLALACVYVTVNYCLAKDYFPIIPLFISGLIESILFLIAHQTPHQIMIILISVNSGLLLFLLIDIFIRESKTLVIEDADHAEKFLK